MFYVLQEKEGELAIKVNQETWLQSRFGFTQYTHSHYQAIFRIQVRCLSTFPWSSSVAFRNSQLIIFFHCDVLV